MFDVIVVVVVQRLADELDEKEDEIRRLRSKVRELEDALSQSRMSAHTANVDKSEVRVHSYIVSCGDHMISQHVVLAEGVGMYHIELRGDVYYAASGGSG